MRYLRRLRPHFWVGYGILGSSMVHAGRVMPAMRRAHPRGIQAATAAFFRLLFEVVLGLCLKDERLPGRGPARRLYFWTMAAFVGALG